MCGVHAMLLCVMVDGEVRMDSKTKDIGKV
jgi:hypothetical protein